MNFKKNIIILVFTSLSIVLLVSYSKHCELKKYQKNSEVDNIYTSKTKTANTKDTSNNKLLGVWKLLGEEIPSFRIDERKIFYVDDNKYYKYLIQKDTIVIDYDGFKKKYKFQLAVNDTLILTGGDSTQTIFVRVKADTR